MKVVVDLFVECSIERKMIGMFEWTDANERLPEDGKYQRR